MELDEFKEALGGEVVYTRFAPSGPLNAAQILETKGKVERLHRGSETPPFEVRWLDTFDMSSSDYPERFETIEAALEFASERSKDNNMFMCCVFDANGNHLRCTGEL